MGSTEEKSTTPLQPAQRPGTTSTRPPKDKLVLILLALAVTAFVVNIGDFTRRHRSAPTYVDELPQPLDFSDIEGYCSKGNSIVDTEFHARQDSLAKLLLNFNASAYIAEPGANGLFYGNVSNANWRLSERPLLLVVTPEAGQNDVQAQVSILTPKFEATRAKMIPIPFPGKVQYATWAEEANPYEQLGPLLTSTSGIIYVDGNVRHFIVEGLQKAFPSARIESAPSEIRQLRERKSPAEIELMKIANEATLLAIRNVRDKLYLGIRESEAQAMMAAALKSTGLSDGGCLTLFGENAALPHGSGTDRVLGVSDFVLLDCTANLHGYESDVTRTIALDTSEIPPEHKAIWQQVKGAQNVAFRTVRVGIAAKKIDQAARLYLSLSGNDKYFTHRLGHGIGIEGHEDPYLNGGSETILQTGHSFSDEPGVYIEGKIGVRLEDCFYINEDGLAEYLTAGAGGAATSPWSP